MMRHPANINLPTDSRKSARVLQILHTDERGGIETLSGMIVQGLAGHGIQVDTLTLFPRPDLGAPAKLACVAKAAIHLLRNDYEAIIAYQATASILTGLCGFIRGCPRRIVHQTAVPSATAWPVRFADKIAGTLGLYTANVANTSFTRREFSQYPARYQRFMTLIVHGVVPPAARLDRTTTRARFHLPQDIPLILNVGRMVSQKNQRVLVEALAQVQHGVLVVAGHGPDEIALLDLAQRAGVSERLRLIGAVKPEDVADLLKTCDVFAFPSTWETFGLAAAEAAMTSIPMIVSDLAVLREVLASTASPVQFVASDDINAWAAALNEAITSPPAQHKRDGFALEIAQRYAVSGMINAYVALLTGASTNTCRSVAGQ